MSNSKLLAAFVRRAQQYHINSFIIDLKRPNDHYAKAIDYVRQHHIQYIARIVIFPGGAHTHHVTNKFTWQSKWAKIRYALELHASAIQLDYIRYHDRRRATQKNVDDIVNIVRYFHTKLRGRVPLQVDVFGLVAHHPLRAIGQDARALAPYINGICPMVYPSHYQLPYRRPENAFRTVYMSLSLMKKQLHDMPNVKIYAYIEAYSYRYRMSWPERVKYMQDQIRAAREAKVSGWYVWSAGNKYAVLYDALNT